MNIHTYVLYVCVYVYEYVCIRELTIQKSYFEDIYYCPINT